MKLVVDLTHKMYQAVKDGTWCGNELWYNALKTATPLEEVLGEIKGEINKKISHYDHFSSSNTAHGLEMALEIIDKYVGGKEQP